MAFTPNVELPDRIVLIPAQNEWEQPTWKCARCDFTDPNWHAVLGHQGRHSSRPKSYGRKGKARAKEVIDMTITELIETVEKLREENVDLRKRASDAESRLSTLRSVFSDAVAKDGP